MARLRIPPILLEGDEYPAPAVSGPGRKFALGALEPAATPPPPPPPISPAPVVLTPPDLTAAPEPAPSAATVVPPPAPPPLPPPPAVEPTTPAPASPPQAWPACQVSLMIRDPEMLYVHWVFTPEFDAPESIPAAARWRLRLRCGDPGATSASEIPFDGKVRSCFLPISGRRGPFQVEVGVIDLTGQWQGLGVSPEVGSPPPVEHPEPAVTFETLPVDLPFADLREKVQEVAQTHRPLIAMLEVLRHHGYPDLPSPPESAAPVWTAEQERALASVLRIEPGRRIWIGSLELTELVKGRLEAEAPPSAGAAEEVRRDAPSSPAAGFAPSPETEAAVGPSSGETATAPTARRGFWFNVNVELIVYGATEPDAQLTVAGRPIRLRPDGTFSLRFALPDGEYALPLQAVSASGDDRRHARLEMGRRTAYAGEVGAVAQAPGLKPPRPEHVGAGTAAAS